MQSAGFSLSTNQTPSKTLSKPQAFPENHLYSFKLSTFPPLSALFAERSATFLSGTGSVSYFTTVIFLMLSPPPLHANRFACLSSCFIVASLSQQTFRGQRAKFCLFLIIIKSKFLRMTYFTVTEAWLVPHTFSPHIVLYQQASVLYVLHVGITSGDCE